MDRTLEIAEEQKYFDIAQDARERSRQALKDAPKYAAGPKAAVRGVRKGAQAQLDQLGAADDPVAFGRLDLEDDDETFYIGYRGIAGDDGERLVVNWQLEFVSRLWALGAQEAVGELRRRRRFETERNTIVDIDDEVFAEIAKRIEELTSNEEIGIDDALLNADRLVVPGVGRRRVDLLHPGLPRRVR
ncbi:hypothetical protein [Nocardioides ferulae]|uniref:hypothetical protein n=1 Tax=Nocardioides ferulae TaxID=2340821 RepID=UPI000EB5BE53|nr:hypothetical protein [Nocardioides ferulae]